MKLQLFSGKRAGFLLALFCALGFTLAASTTAQAQYPYGQYPDQRDNQSRRDRDRDWRRNRDRDRDRRDRDRDDRYNRDNGYGNNGYGTYGRNGGYGNNGGYGGYGGYEQAAVNQGFQYGLNTGASDAQRRQSYDPQRSHYFRNASSQAFRQGFVQGYDQGYRQYSGNGRYGRNYPNRTGSILGSIFGRP